MGSRWDWEAVEDRMGRLGKIGGKKGSVVVPMTLKNKWSDNRRVRGCQGVSLRSERGWTDCPCQRHEVLGPRSVGEAQFRGFAAMSQTTHRPGVSKQP